jgi:hypothetical protein
MLSVSKKWPGECANTPGPGPQLKIDTVDTKILRNTAEKVPAPTPDETPHGCYEGWVYLGFEGEDESGQYVEVT